MSLIETIKQNQRQTLWVVGAVIELRMLGVVSPSITVQLRQDDWCEYRRLWVADVVEPPTLEHVAATFRALGFTLEATRTVAPLLRSYITDNQMTMAAITRAWSRRERDDANRC